MKMRRQESLAIDLPEEHRIRLRLVVVDPPPDVVFAI